MRIDDRLEAEDRALLARAGEIAAGTGVSAYLVGGPVRDLLLGRPAPDLDLAVEGAVEELTRVLAGRLGARVRKTTRFMTSTIVLPDGRELDVARTRTESYPEPGALPVVTPAPLSEDLGRRDFSVNAMAMCIEPSRFGELVDPHGGRSDLRHTHLRVLHDSSFEDDPTRMLRAVRFVLRLNFTLEPTTAELLQRAVDERRAASVSGARVRNEMECIFGEAPSRALEVLQELHMLEGMGLGPASPEACELARFVPCAARALGIELSEIDPLAPCLGVYAGLSDQNAAGLAVALMLDAGARDAILQSAAAIEHPPGVLRDGSSDGRLYFALRGLRRASAIALWTVLDGEARAGLERYWLELRDSCADIGGLDLIEAGYEPGPGFSEALEAALKAKLDDRAGREDQIAVALRTLEHTIT